MRRLIHRIAGARGAARLVAFAIAGGSIGVAVAFAAPLAETETSESARQQPGRMSLEELTRFSEFPVYGFSDSVAGLELTSVVRTSAATLDEAAALDTKGSLVETVGEEPREEKIAPDFVTMTYGECEWDPKLESCSAPQIQIQIWRACNRSLDDYSLAPGVPLPHEKTIIRGTEAAIFDDRVEVYAGSVTIVIFGEPKDARRVAEEMQPLNQSAAAEASDARSGDLPKPIAEADCVEELL